MVEIGEMQAPPELFPLKGKRVLIVEPDPKVTSNNLPGVTPIGQLIAQELQHLGNDNPIMVHSSMEAIQALKKDSYDIVITGTLLKWETKNSGTGKINDIKQETKDDGTKLVDWLLEKRNKEITKKLAVIATCADLPQLNLNPDPFGLTNGKQVSHTEVNKRLQAKIKEKEEAKKAKKEKNSEIPDGQTDYLAETMIDSLTRLTLANPTCHTITVFTDKSHWYDAGLEKAVRGIYRPLNEDEFIRNGERFYEVIRSIGTVDSLPAGVQRAVKRFIEYKPFPLDRKRFQEEIVTSGFTKPDSIVPALKFLNTMHLFSCFPQETQDDPCFPGLQLLAGDGEELTKLDQSINGYPKEMAYEGKVKAALATTFQELFGKSKEEFTHFWELLHVRNSAISTVVAPREITYYGSSS